MVPFNTQPAFILLQSEQWFVYPMQRFRSIDDLVAHRANISLVRTTVVLCLLVHVFAFGTVLMHSVSNWWFYLSKGSLGADTSLCSASCYHLLFFLFSLSICFLLFKFCNSFGVAASLATYFLFLSFSSVALCSRRQALLLPFLYQWLLPSECRVQPFCCHFGGFNLLECRVHPFCCLFGGIYLSFKLSECRVLPFCCYLVSFLVPECCTLLLLLLLFSISSSLQCFLVNGQWI